MEDEEVEGEGTEGEETEDEEMEDNADSGNEVDRLCLERTCRRGVDCLDTVRCQSGRSPDGLFRTVGRTSSKLANAFVHFSAL